MNTLATLSAEELASFAGDDFSDFPIKGPPRSGIVQSASKDLDPTETKFVAGAAPGLISLRFSRDESKAVRTFDFTPFATEQTFGRYEPTVGTTRGALIETLAHKPAEARWQANASGKRQCVMHDQTLIKESRTVYMAI